MTIVNLSHRDTIPNFGPFHHTLPVISIRRYSSRLCMHSTPLFVVLFLSFSFSFAFAFALMCFILFCLFEQFFSTPLNYFLGDYSTHKEKSFFFENATHFGVLFVLVEVTRVLKLEDRIN